MRRDCVCSEDGDNRPWAVEGLCLTGRQMSDRDQTYASGAPPKIVGTATVAPMLGMTQRTVRTLAVKGHIPSAFRVTDTSAWRFDEARVREWVIERQRAVQTSAEEYRRRWTSLVSPTRNSIQAYERAIGLRRGGARSSGNQLARAIAEREKALKEGGRSARPTRSPLKTTNERLGCGETATEDAAPKDIV